MLQVYADPRYATITNVINDPNESEQSKKNFQNREIWVQVNDFLVQNRPNETRFDVIKRLTNERISNLRHGLNTHLKNILMQQLKRY